jgi:NAD(P)-dependent dehydrogenase (short-subunit alcohol dehydrogenase family)
MASITLPRPSRKGNLANVVAPIPVNTRATIAEKRSEKEREKMRVSTEERAPWHVLRETRTRLCSPGYIVDLVATIALYYRDTLQLPSNQKKIRECIK